MTHRGIKRKQNSHKNPQVKQVELWFYACERKSKQNRIKNKTF
jgi:hypothetical protein